jgi:hypothetical protein
MDDETPHSPYRKNALAEQMDFAADLDAGPGAVGGVDVGAEFQGESEAGAVAEGEASVGSGLNQVGCPDCMSERKWLNAVEKKRECSGILTDGRLRCLKFAVHLSMLMALMTLPLRRS